MVIRRLCAAKSARSRCRQKCLLLSLLLCLLLSLLLCLSCFDSSNCIINSLLPFELFLFLCLLNLFSNKFLLFVLFLKLPLEGSCLLNFEHLPHLLFLSLLFLSHLKSMLNCLIPNLLFLLFFRLHLRLDLIDSLNESFLSILLLFLLLKSSHFLIEFVL